MDISLHSKSDDNPDPGHANPVPTAITAEDKEIFNLYSTISRILLSSSKSENDLRFILGLLGSSTNADIVLFFEIRKGSWNPETFRLVDSWQPTNDGASGKDDNHSYVINILSSHEKRLKAGEAITLKRKGFLQGSAKSTGEDPYPSSMSVFPAITQNDHDYCLFIEFFDRIRFFSQFESFILGEIAGSMASLNSKANAREIPVLRESETDNFLKHSADAIAIINTEGLIRNINKAFELLFQYPAEEVIGKNIHLLIPAEENGGDNPENFLQDSNGVRDNFKRNRLRKNGDRIICSISSLPIQDVLAGELIYCIYHDLTDVLAFEKHNLITAEKFRNLFEFASDGILLFDGLTIIDCNKAALEQFKCTRKELIGKTPIQLSPDLQNKGETSDSFIKNLETAIRKKGSIQFEWLFNRSDGSSFTAEISLSRLEMDKTILNLATCRDITSRNANLRTLNQRYEIIDFLSRVSSELINLDPDAIDDVLYSILQYSGGFAECDRVLVYFVSPDKKTLDLKYGWYMEPEYKIEDLAGKIPIADYKLMLEYIKVGNVVQFQRSSIVQRYGFPELAQLLENVGIKSMLIIPLLVNNRFIGCIGYTTAVKEMKWENETINPLRLTAQIIANAIERKKVVEERNKALVKAEESDRLKTAFLASMSHEIRTPMNHILGFVELLKDSDLTEKEKYDYFDIVKNSGNLLLHLIDDIIDIAKIESNQVEVNPVKMSVIAFLNNMFTAFNEHRHESKKDHLDFRLVLPANLKECDIYADLYRLQQILSNLISNALKFTSEGFIHFGFTIEREDTLKFFVSDSGIGIPPEKRVEIFDRFRQLDNRYSRQYGGTGLGLAISKGLVELMGGKIWIESHSARGSDFCFTIPYTRVQSEPQDTFIGQKLQKLNWTDKTILIVEDDEINFKFLSVILQKTKATLLRAGNGQEAIDITFASKPDLILMDIQIPIIDGYLATQTIKASFPEIPIIAQTAHAFSDERDRCIEAGADDYVTKPINRSDLIARIDALMQR
jgi:PAS domain S-box-containing protein